MPRSFRFPFFPGLAAAALLAAVLAMAQKFDEQALERFKKIVEISRDDAALKEYLKPIPPMEIADAMKAFEVVPGFRVDLVAHEPLVTDPIVGVFDEDGRLYIGEMSDYPYQPGSGEKPLGRIRLLEDTDGDGTFDEGHIFADQLLWPSGVVPWKGGVFVSATPDIWYLKDTDGDNKADVRQKVYTGFGTQNEQMMVNNLIYGVDHLIYGATGANGGSIVPVGKPGTTPISVNGRDFRFDPAGGTFEVTSETFQFGNSFDNWYNRFVCNQSMPARHAAILSRYLDRNPYIPAAQGVNPLAIGQTRIFKISPAENWRNIREAQRIVAGYDPENAGVSHDYLTAGAGVTIYRGDAYPPEFEGNVFIGESTGNAVHRRLVIPDGVTFQSRAAYTDTEFVRSEDIWFRPVNFVNAPDGTLHVLDMYREFTESTHVPENVMKHLDYTSGRDRGRIYRMAPQDFKIPPPIRLSNATTAELVSHLESTNGWRRENAHRLIYERQDKAAVAPLRLLLAQTSRPLARMHALWSLSGLGSLRDEDLLRGLSDSSFGVREHAVRLAESRLNSSPKVFDKVVTLARDESPRVRLQVALVLGETDNHRAASALARIIETDSQDRWMRTAVLSSSTKLADRLFQELTANRSFLSSPAGGGWLEQLARIVGARGVPEEVQRLLASVTSGRSLAAQPDIQQTSVIGLVEGLRSSRKGLAAMNVPSHSVQTVELLVERAETTATDSRVPEERRLAAIRLLGHSQFENVREALVTLIDPRQPQPVQLAAMDALTQYTTSSIEPILLKPWDAYSPEVRRKALESLLTQEPWTLTLLNAIEAGNVPGNQIDANRRSLLMDHRDESIRTKARKLFESDVLDARHEVLAKYRTAIAAVKGDKGRGHDVYIRECVACHRLGFRDHPIGPNLVTGSFQDPEALLIDIIDPNRYVSPEYIQYVVTDRTGKTHTGFVKLETAESITLQMGDNVQSTIPRQDVAEVRSMGKSLMPEGLENTINPQEIADLIEFILSAQYQLGPETGGVEPSPAR